MSDTILSADMTVYYVTENRQKRVVWSGAAADTRTVKEMYLALMDLFDGQTQMREGEPIKADTPTDYTYGQIDTNDPDPWFIDRTTVEHLVGAILRTAGWARVVASETGIVRVTCNNTNIVVGDIGEDIVTDTDGDQGVLLDVKGTGAGSELWIRPDDDTAGNSFDDSPTASDGITCNTHTAIQSGASETGESLWSNPFTIGTIQDFSHIYFYQDGVLLTEYKQADIDSWWGRGHIDILVPVQEVGTLIDDGFVTALIRKYTASYDYFITDLSAGLRSPIPFSTAVDLDNPTGYRTINTGVWAVSNYEVGEEIIGTTSTAKGIVTAAVVDTSVTYFLLDDLTDFQNTETMTGQTSGTTSTTASVPGPAGPASLAGLSIAHANTTADIDEDTVNELYSITIDCSDEALTDVWEWLKYTSRRGNTGSGDTDGIAAESYLGNDRRVPFDSETGSVTEGAVVTQLVSGATGTVVAKHGTGGAGSYLILRNSRGTFDGTNNVELDGSNYVVVSTAATVLVPIKKSPFGDFAGGKFFGADGVLLLNFKATDTNNFQLVDDEGNVVTAPIKVTVEVGNTRELDRILVARTTSGVLNDDEYKVDATQPVEPSNTLVADSSITTDTPATGRVVVFDVSAFEEHVYRYLSYAGDTFTLFNQASTTMEALSDDDTIIDTGAFAAVKVGDIIKNTTQGAWAYVAEVVSANEVTLDRPISGQASGNSYIVGSTVDDYTTSDQIWVPFILENETTGDDVTPGDEQTSVTFTVPIPVLIRARNATSGVYKIKPFVATGSIGSSGLSINVIRNAETIT